jgi:hypothetical protein
MSHGGAGGGCGHAGRADRLGGGRSGLRPAPARPCLRAGELKRLVVESPWPRFISACQRYRHPLRLNQAGLASARSTRSRRRRRHHHRRRTCTEDTPRPFEMYRRSTWRARNCIARHCAPLPAAMRNRTRQRQLCLAPMVWQRPCVSAAGRRRRWMDRWGCMRQH